MISSAGLVSEIDRIDSRDPGPRVRYYPVDLNGRPFKAAWAGQGSIALWGQDGLGTIDTRNWTMHHIADRVTAALATPWAARARLAP